MFTEFIKGLSNLLAGTKAGISITFEQLMK